MSERQNIIHIFSKKPLESPEYEAYLIQRLTDLDVQREPLNREAEALMRELGMLGVERGLDA